MSTAWTIDGMCDGRAARLKVSEQALEWSQGEGVVVHRIELAEGVKVSIVDRGPTGVFATAGVFLVALAALWAIDRSVSWPVWATTGGVGLVLLRLGFLLRVALLQVVSPQLSFALVCHGKARRLAREAVEALREARPGNARKPSASVVQFMLGEVRSLSASQASLAREYRLIAGEKAEPQMQARFVAARKKIALWNVLWTFVLPLAGALGSGAVFARFGTAYAAIGTLVSFVVLVFVGLKALPRLQPLLARLLA